MLGAISVLNSAASKTDFYVQRRSGSISSQQGNESDLRLFLYQLFFLAGLLTVLWVMHLNAGYNNNIFLCHGGKECVRKQP